MPRYQLAGRTVLLTGSTGGLGTALAKRLRESGAKLALLDLNRMAAEAQAASLGGPALARGWHADVTDLASLESATNAAAAHFGGIDVVIANAGIDTVGSLTSLEPSVFERVIDVNLNGVWRTFRAGVSHVQQTRGYLLAISSMAAFVHSPLQASYTASKAGVWAMCNSIRLELRHLGVDVGTAHPVFFRTPLTDDLLADPAGREVWGGNESGLWKMIPMETVLRELLAGIEARADTIVIPRRNSLIGMAPGVFRPLIERLGFPRGRTARAVGLTATSDGHGGQSNHRHHTVLK
jgi:NAD(P)-dependent dehydrogenase (short-subunit alcohol dehydrogenase family)